MAPSLIQPIHNYYLPMQSIQEVEAYRGQLVEFSHGERFGHYEGIETIFGDHKLYAYIVPISQKTPEGDTAYDFKVFGSVTDLPTDSVLTTKKLVDSNLRFRLLNVWEVEEVNRLMENNTIKINLDQYESSFLQYVIDQHINRLNFYRHFSDHSQEFHASGYVIKLPDRTKLLQKIDEVLESGYVRTAAIVGMTGMGKTALVKQYMHAQSSMQKYVFRAYFDTRNIDTLYKDYIKLAEQQAIDYPKDASQDAQMIYIKKWLSEKVDCLFVYDNIMDQSLIDKYVPQEKNHVLLISKNPNIFSRSKTIALKSLSMDDAKFLLKEMNPIYENSPHLEPLIKQLGHLPLALTQAATYMDHSSTSIPTYLSLLRHPKFHKKMLSYNEPYAGQEHEPVWTAFDEDLKSIENQYPRAFLLLQRLCQLPETWIQRDELVNLVGLKYGKNADLDINDDLARLNQYSMIEFSDDLEQIKINVLLRDIIRSKYSIENGINNTNRLFSKNQTSDSSKNKNDMVVDNTYEAPGLC